MRRHFLDDLRAIHLERIIGWPIGHLVQKRPAVIAPVEVVMAGFLGAMV